MRRRPLGPITPRILSSLVVAFVALGATAAEAQTTGTAGTIGTTTTQSLADGDIFIGIQAVPGTNLTDFDLARFFNKAACDCNVPVYVYFSLTTTGFSKRSFVPAGTVSFWVGSQCNDPLLQQTNCLPLGSITSGATATSTSASSEQIVTFMALGRETIQTTAQTMSTPSINALDVDGGIVTQQAATAPCTSPTNGFNQTVWAIFDYGSDGTIDYAASQAVFVDLVPPPAPAAFTVVGGDEAVTLRWTAVDYTLNTDLQGYQILCQRAGGLQVFGDNTFTSYVKSCPTTRTSIGPLGLDPAFVCSPLLDRSVTAYRVKILQNGIPYGAAVVSIDNSGNASAPLANSMGQLDGAYFATPAKTDSFYDVYRDGNVTNGAAGQMATPGQATGGFCNVAGGDGPGGRWHLGLGLGLGVAIVAGLARARRRRSR